MCSEVTDMGKLFGRTFSVLIFLLFILFSAAQADEDAKGIIKAAINHYRDVSSYSVGQMLIHRPTWERSMEMKVWTEGLDKSLVRIISPKKDEGSGSLLIGDHMWSFTPKINRIIKIPSSMSHQSWMGSDFSNNDIARADDLLDKYTHTLQETREQDGMHVYVVKSVPHDNAPVVWGKEIVTIREDYVLLEHAFYDQEGVLVKMLVTSNIRVVSGKNVATVERMQKANAKDEWTEFRLKEVVFGLTIPKNTFTLSNLRNPRF